MIVTCASLVGSRSAAADLDGTPSSRLANYQEFLTNRPNVARMNFFQASQLTTNLLKRLAPELKLEPGRERNTTSDAMIGSWEPGRFAFSTRGPSGTNSTASFGFNNGTYWQISGGVVTLCATNDTTYVPTLKATLEGFLDVLNLGIPSVQYGTMVWDGLSFRASGRNGDVVSGSLVLKDGAPFKLLCEIGGHQWAYLVTYFYGDEIDPLPDRYTIAVKEKADSHYDELASVTITDLVTTRGRLEYVATVLYAAPQYANQHVWLLISNGQTIATTPSGNILRVLPSKGFRQSSARTMVIAAMVFTSAIMLMPFLRKLKSKTKTSQNE